MYKTKLTLCDGRSMGEEISGLKSLRLFFVVFRLIDDDDEEDADAVSLRLLTRLIIFLAAQKKKHSMGHENVTLCY